jgi:hypothetical protein
MATVIISCKNQQTYSAHKKNGTDSCMWLYHDEKQLENLFKNQYANQIADSFINGFYISYYKLKIQAKDSNKDSIGVLELKIIPHLVETPHGDSDVFDLTFAFKDTTCSPFYDSIIKSKNSMIFGLRFSLSKKSVICYLSNRSLMVDSNFMNIKEKIKSVAFKKFIEAHNNKIDPKVKYLLQNYK